MSNKETPQTNFDTEHNKAIEELMAAVHTQTSNLVVLNLLAKVESTYKKTKENIAK